ncbi:MAG: translocation/assembly module TamB domain-containing protein [Cytophagales bacterium]|nr:translocation/assembly module TamB domain-containing protein [Cytophagales bacterium]
MLRLNNIIQFIRRLLIIAFFAFVFMFTGVLAIVQLPTVQTYLLNYITSSLAKVVNYPISIKHVSINWIDKIQLDSIMVKDADGNPMISVKYAQVRYKLSSLLQKNPVITEITAHEPVVITKYLPEIDNYNIKNFIYSFRGLGSRDTSKHIGKYTEYLTQKLTVVDATFIFEDKTVLPRNHSFDFYHFTFHHINGSADNFKLVADTISFEVENLSATDKYSNLKLECKKFDFSICENFMKINDLDAKLGNSRLSKNITFTYDTYNQLAYIQDSVMMNIEFDNTHIDFDDLKVFVPDVSHIRDSWILSGNFTGFFHNFNFKNARIDFGAKSYFSGNVHIKDFAYWDKTYFDIAANEAYILPADIIQYELKPYENHLNKFAYAYLSGLYKGTFTNFDTDMHVRSGIGDFDTDLRMAYLQDSKDWEYDGIIKTNRLHIGKIIENEHIDEVSSVVKIKGKGLQLENQEMVCDAAFSSITTHNYHIMNSICNINSANRKLNLALDIKDSGIVSEINLIYNVQDPLRQVVEAKANIHRFNIHKTGMYSQPVHISTDIYLNAANINKKDREVHIKLEDSYISNKTANYRIGDAAIDYEMVDSNLRRLSIESDVADIVMIGDYDVIDLQSTADKLIRELKASFNFKDTIPINNYIKKQGIKGLCKNVDYTLHVKNIAPLSNTLLEGLYFSKDFTAKGTFSNIPYNKFILQTSGDTVQYHKYKFIKPTLTLDFLKQSARDIKRYMTCTVNTVEIDKNNSLENITFDGFWLNDSAQFLLFVKQYNENNNADIIGKIHFFDDSIRLTFPKARIALLDNQWKINEENSMVFTDKFVSIHNTQLEAEDQQIIFASAITEQGSNPVKMYIENFKLNNLNKLFKTNLQGQLDGFVSVENVLKSPIIHTNLHIKALKHANLYIGDIKGGTFWDNSKNELYIKASLDRMGKRTLNAGGTYTPAADSLNKVNMIIDFDKTHLSVIEPFIEGVASDLDGSVSGRLWVKGSLGAPKFGGSVEINDGKFTVDYLNTTYYMNDKIDFFDKGLNFRNVVLNDDFGGLAVVNGGLFHNNFKNMNYIINGEYKNTNILNTTARHNEYYYGKAFATGSFDISGSYNDVHITLKATSQKNTKLYVPLQYTSDLQTKNFINFAGKKNKAAPQSADATASDDNFRAIVDMNIELTPDAYCEIIFDMQTGDKISGYGDANFKMEIDTKGDYKMYGDYVFAKDSYYNFNFINVVSKKFRISPQSRITFNGSPYDGDLHIDASYEDRVSLVPLLQADLDTATVNKPGLKNPYPVHTMLKMNGELLHPKITYDIAIKDYPTVIEGVPLFNYVQYHENRWRNNENEMNRQVFSLLVFRKFLSPNNSNMDGQQAIGGTVSEFLTRQLSDIVSKLDENLRIDLNVNNLNRDALNSMQLRISYELFDGKIRITRSGGVTNSQQQTTASSVAGDWTVEYMLTDDGKFRLKGFNKNNPNPFGTGANRTTTNSTGMSIMHTQSFDKFPQLIKKKEKPKKPN